MNNATRVAVAHAAQDELARRRLLDFERQLVPNYQEARHVEKLGELLESAQSGNSTGFSCA